MKFRKLSLLAFGPFTGTEIDFGESQQGLHIIYGPNEAGKSSALRAIHNFLFGFPPRTSDGFLHPYSSLRIGATLESAEGGVMTGVRRKGQKQTLRDGSDQDPIDESKLTALMPAVSEDLFRSMFGIDHPGLRAGGESIAKGEGHVGQLLFSAGGVIHLRERQQRLQSAAEAFLTSSGRSGEIVQLLKTLQEKRDQLKEVSVSVDRWNELSQRKIAAQAKKREVEAEQTCRQTECNRLQRLHDALPQVSEWRSTQAEAEKYSETLILSEDFSRRRSDCQNRLAQTEALVARITADLASLDQEILKFDVDESLLECAEEIDQLMDLRGSHLKAMKDRREREVELRERRQEQSHHLRELGRPESIENLDALHLPRDRRIRIQELASEFSSLLGRVKQSEEEREQLQVDLNRVTAEQEAVGESIDVRPLQSAIPRVQKLGSLDQQIQQATDELARLEIQLDQQLAALRWWDGSAKELVRLAVPNEETIDRFEDRFREIQGKRDQAAAAVEKLCRDRQSLDDALAQLERGESIPSEEELARLRHLRRQGWELIQIQLEGTVPEEQSVQRWLDHFPSAISLANTFEQLLTRTDELADRLRREAGRVAEAAQIQTQRDRCDQEIQQMESRLSEWDQDRAVIEKDWHAEWPFLTEGRRTPSEMRAWLRDQQKLVTLIGEHDLGTERHRRLADARRDAEQLLLNAAAESSMTLSNPPSSLDHLLEQCLSFVQESMQLDGERKQQRQRKADFESRLQLTEKRLNQANEELKTWRAEWAEQMEKLGLKADTKTAEATSVLDTIGQLLSTRQSVESLQERLAGIDRDAEEFRTRTVALANRLSLSLGATSPEDFVRELSRKRHQNDQAASQRATLEQQQAKLKSDVKKAEQKHHEAQTQSELLCQEAGGVPMESLSQVEADSSRKRQLMEKQEFLRESLAPLAGGETLEEFLASVEEQNADSLKTEIQRLEERLRELSGERDLQIQELETVDGDLRRLSIGGDAALRQAEEIESTVATLEEQVRECAALRVASAVLTAGIERYRERNQGPVLRHASELFATLTNNSFQGIQTDYTDKGDPILVGVRGDERVHVEGMSDGTRDQLYLALRIASVENWVDQHSPVPFIVDDVLITFDDDRSRATLGVLAELSRRTQVIFFTHHEHLISVAEEALPSDLLHIHRLGENSPAKATNRKKKSAKTSQPALFSE
ncbi:MAG: AAA family ATPase [Planctomycetaceae bacterium]|nr:AAA family ATPase [Planctomycetaceae bacterium]